MVLSTRNFSIVSSVNRIRGCYIFYAITGSGALTSHSRYLSHSIGNFLFSCWPDCVQSIGLWIELHFCCYPMLPISVDNIMSTNVSRHFSKRSSSLRISVRKR